MAYPATINRLVGGQVEMIQTDCNHGETLEKVMANIRHQPYEISAIFDRLNRKICEGTSESPDYALLGCPSEFIDEAFLVLHNHIVDGTFSETDLFVAVQYDINVLVLVTPHYNFSLFP